MKKEEHNKPEGREELPLEEFDGVDYNQVAEMIRRELGIEQPPPGQPIKWPNGKRPW